MSEQIGAPRGVYDLLPDDTDVWQKLESGLKDVISRAGYREIRVPIFEHTELFKRGVGETTDIVNKEMYTFNDKSDRSLTLRPEGTAGVVRAYLSNGLHRQSPPVKLWYFGPMFRYERTQTGRQRQFHQIGLEALGSEGPAIDAEVIAVAFDCLNGQSVNSCTLKLNSIGCSECRPLYREKLKTTLQEKLPILCDDCRDRFERNPLRMLDCKTPTCQAQYTDVPSTLDNLCQPCQAHWQGLLTMLESMGIKPQIDSRLVRGLDYYCRTVFEFVSDDSRLGAQATVLAGGRYDYLIETLGGSRTPAIGWAMGMERLRMLVEVPKIAGTDVFVVSTDQTAGLALATQLRRAGLRAEMDYPPTGNAARAFGRQLQQASKSGARVAVIAGTDELADNTVTIKDLGSGKQEKVPRDEFVAHVKNLLAPPVPERCMG